MFGGGLDSPVHILLLLVVVLLLFGAKRLPEVGRSLGHGIREFKQAVTGSGGSPRLTEEPPAERGEGPSPA